MGVRVKVLYFGPAREAVGRGVEFISLASGSSVGSVVDEAMRLHRGLRELSGTMQLALNEEVAARDERVEEGDTIAFLPPVAGV